MEEIKIYKGNIIFTKEKDQFTEIENGYIIVQDNRILEVSNKLDNKYKDLDLIDYGDRLIIPGFVDLHVHASQFSNRGLGMDQELIPWLDKYTFPEEAKFKDQEYAKKVYSHFVHELWKFGTTNAVIFATIHRKSSNILMDLLEDAGINAFVGKVNMDRNSPDFLIESKENSIEETEAWLKENRDKESIVRPIITPRFVPSCSGGLMEELGNLAKKYQVPIQSHLSENRDEVEWVKDLHPDSENYSSVYDEFKLFGQQPTIMAHCVYNNEDEIELMAEKGVFVAHSPISNLNLSSGMAPIRKYLEAEVKVGLATDVSGGHSISMMDVIAATIQSSKMRWVYLEEDHKPLTLPESFYLATKGGGEFFGKTGSFEKGYSFDALVIDDTSLRDLNPRSLSERLQRFIYLGDDRNIYSRYANGKELKAPKIY